MLKVKPKGASKVKTKASLVKHLKKKNLKINDKITFDEEGKVSCLVYALIKFPIESV